MSYFIFWDIGSKQKGEHKFYFVETNHGLEHAVEVFSSETKLDPYKIDSEFYGTNFRIHEFKSPLDFFSSLVKNYYKNESVKFLNFSSFKI